MIDCSFRQHQHLQTRVDLGRWWRFAVLGDPTVRRFGIRDLDMFLLDRERAAVREWEEEGTKQVEILTRSSLTFILIKSKAKTCSGIC